jgi:uncharacterized protein (DUF58 family)
VLTRRGWAAVALAVVFVVAGRLLGAPELYVLGATVGALVVGVLAYLTLTRLDIDVARELHPARVHAGSPSRVDLRVRNEGRRRSPVLTIRDAVSGTRGANLLVPPLEAGGVARAAYRLPTERRGLLTVGPLEVALADPFGLARLTMQASGVQELVVFPHVDEIAPVPQTSGNDPMAGAEHPNALGRNGEDFYALRQYVVGDDLRRVHWASTARHDELMVRQDELPWQGRATVLLDARASSTNADSLELVISAVASIVAAGSRRQDLVRVAVTDGFDSGFAAGNAHVERILEHLARMTASNDAGFRRMLDSLARTSTGGALVVVGADLAPTDVERIARLRRRFGSVTLVKFDPASYGATGPMATPPPAREGVLRIATAPFAATWDQAFARDRPRRRWVRPDAGAGRAGPDRAGRAGVGG